MSTGSKLPTDDVLVEGIVAADNARIAAVLARDRHALESIMSDELIYVHSSGTEETKALYIQRVVSGQYDYRSFVITRRDIRVINDLVFVNGDNEVDIVINQELRQLAGRYLMVWKMERGRWRLVTFHAAPVKRSEIDN